ncbi:MAG TPA: DUF308 domain-containing protein [Mycobacteriales bacterium]|jgi:uncharacterized membrane protein HdeD (DUF308 family)
MTGTRESAETRQSGLSVFAERISHLWWGPLLGGLVSIGLGLAILSNSWTFKVLVVVTGILFIARGLVLALSPSYASGAFGAQVAAGVLGVIAGIVLIVWPGPTLLALAFFVGVWLVLSGGFHIVTAITNRRQLSYWGLMVVMGVLELLLGIWAMRRPELTLALIIVILGLWAVITGVMLCVVAFEVRNVGKRLAALANSAGGDPAQVTHELDRLAQLQLVGQLSPEEYAHLKAALLATAPAAPPMPAAAPPPRQPSAN